LEDILGEDNPMLRVLVKVLGDISEPWNMDWSFHQSLLLDKLETCCFHDLRESHKPHPFSYEYLPSPYSREYATQRNKWMDSGEEKRRRERGKLSAYT
jgi:hypothetical protein